MSILQYNQHNSVSNIQVSKFGLKCLTRWAWSNLDHHGASGNQTARGTSSWPGLLTSIDQFRGTLSCKAHVTLFTCARVISISMEAVVRQARLERSSSYTTLDYSPSLGLSTPAQPLLQSPTWQLPQLLVTWNRWPTWRQCVFLIVWTVHWTEEGVKMENQK